MIDKELALRNVIANQALEALIMTDDEIARARDIINGDLSVDDAIAEIHRELQESQRTAAKTAQG